MMRLRDFSCGLFFMLQVSGTIVMYIKGRKHKLQRSAFYFMFYLLLISVFEFYVFFIDNILGSQERPVTDMLQTTAVKDGDDYVIHGTKWFITGAEGASYAIIMARMEDGSATMFLADMDQPGITVERSMDALDACFTGGHGVVSFNNLRVPAADVLGEVGQGFRYAQVRLAPARLTHCMRWLGQARRAHDGGGFLKVRVHVAENAADEDIGERRVVKAQNHQAREQALAPPNRHVDAEQGCQQAVGRAGDGVGVKQVLPHDGERPLRHDVRENKDGA